MGIFEKGFITILCVDAVFVLISIPLILRKVPRNVVYGFRTRATLGDDFVWYEANAHFGRGLVIASVISALVLFFLHRMGNLSPSFFLKVSIVALALPPLVAMIATARHVRTLAPGGPSQMRPR